MVTSRARGRTFSQELTNGGRPAASTGHLSTWSHSLREAAPTWLGATLLRWAVCVLTSWLVLRARFDPAPAALLQIPTQWDARPFQELAASGYPLDTALPRAAFFPGFPLVLRAVASPFLLVLPAAEAITVAAFLTTTVSSLVVAVLVRRLSEQEFGPKVAALATTLAMVWPTAAFLTGYYSESLYLAFAIAAWCCALRHRWLTAGLLGAAASLTRVNGLFLAVALLVLLGNEIRRGRETFGTRTLASVLLAPLGTLAYFAYLYVRTGDFFVWWKAQELGWARRTSSPWESLHNTVVHLFTASGEDVFHRLQFAADIVAVLVGVLAAILMVRWRRWPELTLTLLTYGSLVTSTVYISVARATLTVFPLYILGAAYLSRRSVATRSVVFGVCLVWMCATMAVFAASEWAG